MPLVEKLDVFFGQGIWNHNSEAFQNHSIVISQLISYREVDFNIWGYTLELWRPVICKEMSHFLHNGICKSMTLELDHA